MHTPIRPLRAIPSPTEYEKSWSVGDISSPTGFYFRTIQVNFNLVWIVFVVSLVNILSAYKSLQENQRDILAKA